MFRRNAAESGSATLAVLVIVIVCVGMAASVLIPGLADHRLSQTDLARERAFQLSEAGIDWAIARVRSDRGEIPSPPVDQKTVGSLGYFVLAYESGASNSLDDDVDGTTDEPDEADYVYVTSTGTAAGISRAIRVVLRRNVQVPLIEASLQVNVETPILDLSGNAFLISGADHDLAGDVDPSLAQKPGIASPARVADLESQVPSNQLDNIQGSGGTPSIAEIEPIDLESLVDQARSAATIIIEPGTHTGLDLGAPTANGVVVAYAQGDVALSGSSQGAGILIVDGDLRISGDFAWTGILIVRGRVIMTGGGSEKRVIGGVLIGEEIVSTVSTTEVTVTGTVDLLYSSAAIEMASQSLVMMSVLAWNETASP